MSIADQARQVLDDHRNWAASTPHVEVITVTPEMADAWLAKNTHNRMVKPRTVAAYAADMAAGRWEWNGDTITFSGDGRLLDGQHRLLAVVESGETVTMAVVRGLRPDTQETKDTNVPRSFGDTLKLRGEPNYTSLAALTKKVWCWERGARRNGWHEKATTPTLAKVLAEHPELRDVCARARRYSDRIGAPSRTTIGLCIWLFEQVDETGADVMHFFDRLTSDEGHVDGDPVLALRRQLMNVKNSLASRTERDLLAVTIKAWNFYRAGETVKNLMWRPGGARPEPFPEPR